MKSHRSDRKKSGEDYESTQNITTDQSFNKLDHKIFSFFQVIGNKKVSAQLQLLQAIKFHYVFYSNSFQTTSIDCSTK